MKVLWLITLLLITTQAKAQDQSSDQKIPAAEPVNADKSLAYVGTREFKVVHEGKDSGMIAIVSKFDEQGRYIIYDHSESEALEIEEDIITVMDGDTFYPELILISGRFSGDFANIRWEPQGENFQGVIDQFKISDQTYQRLAAERQLPEGTMTRAAVLYLAAALPIELGETLELNWFNGLSGQLVPISLTGTGTETITVPAGTFETIKVTQTGGQIGNTIYITKDEPRRIVRFDVTGRPTQLHLMPEE